MSGKNASDQSPQTSYRATSSYVLKADYQRNMLISLVLATIMVTVPCLLIAWWPVSAVTDTPSEHQPPSDSVVVDLPPADAIIIIRDKPGGGTPRVVDDPTGLIVDKADNSAWLSPESIE